MFSIFLLNDEHDELLLIFVDLAHILMVNFVTLHALDV